MATWKHGDSIPDILRKILESLGSISAGGGITLAELLSALSSGTRVGGFAASVANTPSISTLIYASGDCVGGLQSVELARENGYGVVLQSVTLTDQSKQNVPFTLIFFEANPTASTTTDQSAFVLNSADIGKIVGVVEVEATDYVDVTASQSVVTKAGLGIVMQPASDSKTIYCLAVTTGTPTYAGSSNLHFEFGVLRD